ncbi:hypothetical protein LshimejAT787_0211950 [Lyophyllum shimeji]|uniref:Uncharacterized protein n=1 Tax=Lyophyllum shimeji TaxID=47721 RepID=A0A9P3PGN4_LYOSH|nr:hypothetical protein LshimejAT787_0211950 [Lyophyllum shimeji]
MAHYRQYHEYTLPKEVSHNPLRHYKQTPHSQADGDVATLDGGVVHLIQYRIPGTPHSSYEATRCLVLPRRRPNTGEPSFPSIRFAVPGAPGPTLGSIVRGQMQLDRPRDAVLAECAKFSRIRCQIDWPDIPPTTVNLHTADYKGGPLTRELLANEVAAILYRFFKANPEISTNWADVRLLAVSYYRNALVPILALDS